MIMGNFIFSNNDTRTLNGDTYLIILKEACVILHFIYTYCQSSGAHYIPNY